MSNPGGIRTLEVLVNISVETPFMVMTLLLRATTLTYGDLLTCHLFHPRHDRLHFDRVLPLHRPHQIHRGLLRLVNMSLSAYFSTPTATPPPFENKLYAKKHYHLSCILGGFLVFTKNFTFWVMIWVACQACREPFVANVAKNITYNTTYAF